MPLSHHHRSTLRVGSVYIAGGWLAYEIIDEVALRAGMPEWVSVGALALLIVGLPVVLLTAWVQARSARRAPALETDGRDLDPTLHPEFAVPAQPRDRLAAVLTWRRSLLTGAAMFVLLGLGATGFMTARTLGYGSLGTLFAQGVLSADDPILMADFTSERDPALGRTVAEALRIDLVQSSVIRVADARLVDDALRRMQRDPVDGMPGDVALALAQREGLKAVIRGDVSVLGMGYQLTTELVSADGTVLDAFRVTARDSTQLIDAVDRMSNRMRARIGESLRTIRTSEPLSRVSTASIPALRKYSEAQQLSLRTGDMLRAAELYEQAAAIDSTFGMAWLGLAISLSNAGVRMDDMVAALNRAWSLRDRLPEVERWRAVASYETWITGDHRAAADAYRRLLAVAPDNSAARNNLALTLRRLRRHAEAEQVLLQGAPERRTAVEWLNLVAAQFDQGKQAEAEASFAQMQQLRGAHLNVIAVAFGLATNAGDLDRADRLVTDALARLPDNVSAQFIGTRNRAGIAALEGRVTDALRLVHGTSEVAGRIGLQDVQFNLALMGAAGVAYVLDDGARAVQMLDDALARYDRSAFPPRARGHMNIASIYSVAGDTRRARAELDDYEALLPAAERSAARDGLAWARAAIDLREGRPAQALPTLRRLADEGDCSICPLPELGRTYEMLGQQDSAIAVYRRYLETPMLTRFDVDVMWKPVVLFQLGSLYEAAGDADQAILYYAQFADLWKRADPALQPRVDAARRRIAALRSPG
jgi:tetratricopeptide (TPR) repeat protein